MKLKKLLPLSLMTIALSGCGGSVRNICLATTFLHKDSCVSVMYKDSSTVYVIRVDFITFEVTSDLTIVPGDFKADDNAAVYFPTGWEVGGSLQYQITKYDTTATISGKESTQTDQVYIAFSYAATNSSTFTYKGNKLTPGVHVNI